MIPSIAEVLKKEGAVLEVFALTRRDGRALPVLLEANLKVHIREGGNKDHIHAYLWLKEKLLDFKPSLIWSSVARASTLCLVLGKQLSISQVCWQHMANLKFSTYLIFYILRRCPVMWVGDSEAVSQITARRFHLPKERISTWTLFQSKPDAKQTTPWNQGQTFRIGTFGRLHSDKGFDILLKALSLIRQRHSRLNLKFEVIIGGDGKEKTKLLHLKQQINCNNVNFIGYVNDAENFLASLHLYVQPSREEGFCIGVHEAMQAGLAVIASNVGQIPYTIDEGKNGWLIPVEDVELLADRITYALHNPEKLFAMGQAGRRKVNALYSIEKFRQSGQQILQKLKFAN